MKETTLCYIEKENQFLMLYRNKKENDPNAGKWIGVGGKLEAGETPAECVVREVKEETGLTLTDYQYRGVVYFRSDSYEEETMYLFVGKNFEGEQVKDCAEGRLEWVDKDKVLALPTWEGDRIFLERLLLEETPIELTLNYCGEKLISAEFA